MNRISINKKMLALATLSAFIGVGVSLIDGSATPAKATDSPLIQEVDRQRQVLDNHEARITNTEKDVSDLQDKTGTAPASGRVSVPQAPAPYVPSAPSNPDPTPNSNPPADNTIRVVSANKRSEANSEGGSNYFCDLAYGDGSTASQQVGHTNSPSITMPYSCDQFIGQAK